MKSGPNVSPEPIHRVPRPFELFAHNKVFGAVALMVATIAALAWANSPWRSAYQALFSTHARLGFGEFSIDKPFVLWINDGLMAFFFFVVGLEIKREVLAGELSTLRKAALPLAAAVGGMVVPAAVYLAFNAGGGGQHGWGIPMATDIAFALGVLLLLGSRVPVGLKVFLTALAIVDDIGAIIVIAVFYTESIAIESLGVGVALIALSVVANALGVRNAVAYFIVGTLVWVAFLKSGVHATLASVLMAMTIPARTRADGAAVVSSVEELTTDLKRTGLPERGRLLTTEQQHTLHQVRLTVSDATAPLQELEHALLPLVTFLVMPLFALANAGMDLRGDLVGAFRSPVCLGVVVGLVVGKQVGILAFSVAAVRLRVADLPSGVTWRHVHAVAVLGGIGFTMSLFVSSLAFADPVFQEQAKVGILCASVVSAIVGGKLLLREAQREHPSGAAS